MEIFMNGIINMEMLKNTINVVSIKDLLIQILESKLNHLLKEER
jgi:hypothetical protein